MAEQIKEMVDAKINGKKVMIFSKSRCPFCINVKNLMAEYSNLSSENYEVMDIENDPNCSAIQSYLKTLTGTSSVPRVFINGKCIGGNDDTVKLHRSGELSKLLEEQI